MKKCLILVSLFSVFACFSVFLFSGTPELEPEDVKKKLSKMDGSLTEINSLLTVLNKQDADDITLRPVYQYALKHGHYEVALEGWERFNPFVLPLKYSSEDFLVEELYKTMPKQAHFVAGETYRLGLGYERYKNDFKALEHFIRAALLGENGALHYIVGIYKEYDCQSQVLMMRKMGAHEINARYVSKSKVFKSELSGAEKAVAQQKAIELQQLIQNEDSIELYPFDESCAADRQVKQLMGI